MDAMDYLNALIADGYTYGHSSPDDAGHSLEYQADGDIYAMAYITHRDGGMRIAVEVSEDAPNAYWLRGKRATWRDIVHAIAGIC